MLWGVDTHESEQSCVTHETAVKTKCCECVRGLVLKMADFI